MIKKMTRWGYTQEIKNIENKIKGHSRGISGPQGSAIYNVCRDKNKVILDLIQDLQRTSLLFLNNRRGRWQIKSAMTSLFNNGTCVEDAQQQPLSIRLCYKKAFTLIELLVVVLIIGILAAVAVPQYQKAVYKAQGREVLQFIDTLDKALNVYYLQHDTYSGLNENTTDIELPELKHFILNSGSGLDIGTGNSYTFVIKNETEDVNIHAFVDNSPWHGSWICSTKVNNNGLAHKPTRTCADYFDCPGITATYVDSGSSSKWWEYSQTDCIIK